MQIQGESSKNVRSLTENHDTSDSTSNNTTMIAPRNMNDTDAKEVLSRKSGWAGKRCAMLVVCLIVLIALATALGVILSRDQNISSYKVRGSTVGNTGSNVETQSQKSAAVESGANNTKREVDVDTFRDTPDASDPTKRQWPELLGQPSEDAVQIIESERPDLSVYVVTIGLDYVPLDYDEERVWVWKNADGLVGEIPKLG